MVLTETFNSTAISIECDDALTAAAEDVMKKLSALHDSGEELREGFRLRLGWSVLTLRADGSGLRVCEPAFARNPFAELNSTINVTLRVLVSQVRVLKMTGAKGSDVGFEEFLLVRGAALNAPSIFVQRLDPTGKQDSGWLIGDLDRIDAGTPDSTDPGDLKPVRVFELLTLRPEVLQLLALPVGYIVIMKAGEIAQMQDGEGHERWANG